MNNDFRKELQELIQLWREEAKAETKLQIIINTVIQIHLKNVKEMKIDKAMLERQIDNILYCFNIEEQDLLEVLEETIVANSTDEDLFFDYIRSVVNWNFYLYYFLEQEDYEMCAKIRDVIDVEKIETEMMLSKYYPNSQYLDEVYPTLTKVREMFDL